MRILGGAVIAVWLAAAAAAQEPARPVEGAAESVLDERWRQDSDGNGIPDFLEVELGADPLREDCPIQACGPGAAGSDVVRKPRNTLLMLDSSGSMNARLGGQTKIEAAKQALARYATFAAIRDRLGFLVYGHKGTNKEAGKAESCAGIDLLAPIGSVTPEGFGQVLAGFKATGWTPIAAALDQAAEAFRGREGEINRVILVSDGVETCGGDPVRVAERLRTQGLAITVDVIGFDIRDRRESDALRRIAQAGGGSYVEAKQARDLDAFFRTQGEALRKNTEAFICEARNSTTAHLCELRLTSRALERIGRLQLPLSTRSPEYGAYEAVVARIRGYQEARDKEREAARARVDALVQQAQELREAMIRAYGVR